MGLLHCVVTSTWHMEMSPASESPATMTNPFLAASPSTPLACGVGRGSSGDSGSRKHPYMVLSHSTAVLQILPRLLLMLGPLPTHSAHGPECHTTEPLSQLRPWILGESMGFILGGGSFEKRAPSATRGLGVASVMSEQTPGSCRLGSALQHNSYQVRGV